MAVSLFHKLFVLCLSSLGFRIRDCATDGRWSGPVRADGIASGDSSQAGQCLDHFRGSVASLTFGHSALFVCLLWDLETTVVGLPDWIIAKNFCWRVSSKFCFL